ncbi:MAG: hypothetical protein UR69_C0001G0197 [Candidatus Moranbacteria bacterium GW2011_GWE2_35_2-]|nr:MAG: hypothetical protein UR69_C0001G0197 [Candidatus Moranbacteria bacterium GW2011_GWE2_35_2-]KKQ06011.1 MAG: hypothetical protein US15_C0023G0009 [Candidatus Moranbacteria bacterium GW2011_GWF1_36_4]KKQ22805.1 MAG: hypothetical protein US37_C0001G0077 [Candidatus Moranbacteria bacterium GW2011_GWF2_37_11]KKQ28816.1 MAG: hypothetical protein US44_C0006G0036 [Candidatus Moranbacteria bacterium GW2011_GWD1_37_17]KKQ30964.1 MAG: hypothetical protein US47_C0001G0197 [Candidatus Moranbacteria b
MDIKNLKKLTLLFLIVLFCIFLNPSSALTASYDYYVKSSASKDGDGSKDDPFRFFSDALEEADNSDKIFIANGFYDEEDIYIGKSIKIIGESENGVVFSGKILMGNNSLLQNVSLKDARSKIIIEKDANATIQNCTVQNFSGIGIESMPGSGTLEILNSKIKGGDNKGIYVQRGKNIKIIGSEIIGNEEEGIDIRSNVSGIIKNNLITNNNESGIELIVGSANLKISDNKINGNNASGIATQFYKEFSKRGSIYIENNSLSENGKYGVDCANPHNGAPEISYWRNSIEINGNDISLNEIKSINDLCNFIDAVEENEDADNLITENKSVGNKLIMDMEEKEKIRIEEDKKREEKEQKLNEIENIIENQIQENYKTDSFIEKINHQSKIIKFFIGTKKVKLEMLLENIEKNENRLREAEQILGMIQVEAEEEVSILNTIKENQEKLRQQKEFIAEEDKIFGIWKWLSGLFSD